MTTRRLLPALAILVILGLLASRAPLRAEIPANFRTDQLVAWCIVPFDARKRGPAERTEMLTAFGLKRCAYDWRAEHVPTFEEEILQYKNHGIEYFAFWGEHDAAFALFAKHGLKPQIWQTAPSPPGATQEERVAAAVAAFTPLASRTSQLGFRLGLYNHGDWGGEPANLVSVCEALHAAGHPHVGIVYNFHHAHAHLPRFATSFAAMQPHLLCVNLNGMADPSEADTRKILPIGSGLHEAAMIDVVIKSGYDGPIGLIGHRTDEDVALTLRNNLEGLHRVLASLNQR